MPGTENGIGSDIKSPYLGFATSTKPTKPRTFAVFMMAVRFEVPL